MKVLFHAAAVERWLRPELRRGAALGSTDWTLEDVYPQGGGGVALAFTDSDAQRVTVELRMRDSTLPAARRTDLVDILHAGSWDSMSAPDPALAALLEGVALAIRQLEPRTVLVPVSGGGSMDHVRGLAALNLAIPADCAQRCRFCSVRERVSLPQTSAEHQLIADTLGRDLQRAARKGVRVLRVNGIEPLHAPYLFDVLASARELGFNEFHLLSTCRPLADPDFCRRFLEAQPKKFRIYVPVYGSTAERHDGITGAKGSFDDVMAALENLRAVSAPGEVVLTTVLMRDNLDDVVALRDLARNWGIWWEVHLPFPNLSHRDDRFRTCSVTMTEALEAVYREGWWPLADLVLGEIAPCVALTHQRRTGHLLISPSRLRMRTMELAGTFYASAGYSHSFGSERDSAFVAATTACPHRESCALAPVCPQKTYALYAEVHGLDELFAVHPGELDALPNGPEIQALIGEAAGRP